MGESSYIYTATDNPIARENVLALKLDFCNLLLLKPQVIHFREYQSNLKLYMINVFPETIPMPPTENIFNYDAFMVSNYDHYDKISMKKIMLRYCQFLMK